MSKIRSKLKQLHRPSPKDRAEALPDIPTDGWLTWPPPGCDENGNPLRNASVDAQEPRSAPEPSKVRAPRNVPTPARHAAPAADKATPSNPPTTLTDRRRAQLTRLFGTNNRLIPRHGGDTSDRESARPAPKEHATARPQRTPKAAAQLRQQLRRHLREQGFQQRRGEAHYTRSEVAPLRDFALGEIALEDATQITGEQLARASGDITLNDYDPLQALHFDIETTGLSHQQDQIFLVAWLQIDREVSDRHPADQDQSDGAYLMRTHQLFAHDEASERSLLVAFYDAAARANQLCSFNGRAFDLSFMAARAAALGIDTTTVDLHLDLLRAVRERHPEVADRKLQSLERDWLGAVREDDLPGSEAPAAFHALVDGHGADRFAAAALHNRHDVIALLALTIAFVQKQDPGSPPRPVKPAPAGYIHSRRDNPRTHSETRTPAAAKTSASVPTAAVYAATSRPDRWRALREQAAAQIRLGDIDAAVATLEQMTQVPTTDPFPYIELATLLGDRAATPDERPDDRDRAAVFARKACQLAPWSEKIRRLMRRLTVPE